MQAERADVTAPLADAAGMRIRDVEAWVIKSQIPPMNIGGGHSAPVTPDSVLVRITTEDGHQGFGDSWVQQTDARILKAGVLHGVRPLLLGQDSRNVAALWQRQWQAVRNHGLHPAVSATDIALWDLRGRVLGQPVAALLGGPLRDRVEAYATIPWHRPVGEQVELIKATSARGFHGVKVAVGHGVAEDRERIATLREAHPNVLLAVDANGGYDVSDALRVGDACDAYDVRWFEEPVPYTDPQGLAAVGRRMRTPVSGFQSDTTVYALRRYLDLEALSIFQPSIDKCGGITQAQRIAAVLDAWGKRLVPHSAAPPLSFLAALHVSVTAPTGGLMEFMVPELDPADPGEYRLGAAHLRDPSMLAIDSDGWLRTRDAPGLGMEIDMDAVVELQRRN
jgi:D-galactarolactone cycloisomerase